MHLSFCIYMVCHNYCTPYVIVVLHFNKSVQTDDFYTQTLVTYDTPGDAKLNTTPLSLPAAQIV